jgi:hypothetical protein
VTTWLLNNIGLLTHLFVFYSLIIVGHKKMQCRTPLPKMHCSNYFQKHVLKFAPKECFFSMNEVAQKCVYFLMNKATQKRMKHFLYIFARIECEIVLHNLTLVSSSHGQSRLYDNLQYLEPIFSHVLEAISQKSDPSLPLWGALVNWLPLIQSTAA